MKLEKCILAADPAHARPSRPIQNITNVFLALAFIDHRWRWFVLVLAQSPEIILKIEEETFSPYL